MGVRERICRLRCLNVCMNEQHRRLEQNFGTEFLVSSTEHTLMRPSQYIQEGTMKGWKTIPRQTICCGRKGFTALRKNRSSDATKNHFHQYTVQENDIIHHPQKTVDCYWYLPSRTL